MKIQDFSKEVSQLLEAEADIWEFSSLNERILITNFDSFEGCKIDSKLKIVEYPIKIRDYRANAIFTFTDESLEKFYEGFSMSYLNSQSILRYEGKPEDVFKGAVFLDEIMKKLIHYKKQVH